MKMTEHELRQQALKIQDISSYGTDQGHGNLVGVQTFMQPLDYAAAATFYNKMEGYLAAAQSEGWLQPDTIVVFPEFIGTWLVALNERKSAYNAASIDRAMQILILGHLPRFLIMILRSSGRDRIADSVFRMKAHQMARAYQDTFSALAGEFEVTIVAGSIILPSPHVVDGKLEVGSGPLQNVCAVFRPDRSLHPALIRKVYPILAETAFLQGGRIDELPVLDTPAGRLAPLICADSWYPDVYEVLAPQQPLLIVVPNNETPAWEGRWGGYDPGPAPADVDPSDAGSLINRDAWLKYALPGRMDATGAVAGMHVFFRGKMWDLESHGQTMVVTQKETILAPNVDGAALVNYWIGS